VIHLTSKVMKINGLSILKASRDIISDDFSRVILYNNCRIFQISGDAMLSYLALILRIKCTVSAA